MAKISFTPNRQNISHFRVRLVAKLVVIFISITVLGVRIAMAFASTEISSQSATAFLITIPFLGALIFIVIFEYLLYKKLGARILQYSKYVDIAFILVFTAEWMVSLNAKLSTVQTCNQMKYFTMSGVIGLISFSWRTLLPILMTQQWQFKIIPPTSAYIYLLIFACLNEPSQIFFILLEGIFQLVYIILIFYFDHRVNFTLVIGNMQQQQWLQLNNFILNNIPENISILDPNGNCSFANENFKKLMQRRGQSQDVKKFLANIKHIQRIQQDSGIEESDYVQEILPLEKNSNSDSRYDLPKEPRETNDDIQTISTLEELIITFGNLITNGLVKDRSIQTFTGKFHQDDDEEHERSFEIKISLINQQPKKFILLILKDTTQRDLMLSLEGNIKYKDQLLASVSHELRTPLNGNINLIEAAIKSREISEKLKETLLIPAVRSSQFLLHLINDILDMSQIKAQKLRLIFQQANLKETLANTVQLLELHAKKKGITLETNIDPNLSDVFCTDHVRLSQIVLNLMNNSIKFTQRGHVKLSALPLKDSEYVDISVEDTGIGMTEEDTNKLFKDFTHIDCKNREKINPTGVGLGLKIGNDLAKLLGPLNNKGITVTSEIGMGSTFSFLLENKEIGLNSQQDTRLDCKEELSPLIANEFHTVLELGLGPKMTRTLSTKSLCSLGKTDLTSMNSVLSCRCPRVLVVDDDPFNILAYEAILNSLGIKYDCVYSGRSAINKMLNKVRYPCSLVCCPYKVVFMDEEMPEMTGRETVTEIVSLQRQSLLPKRSIIGCTAHQSGEAIENFRKCGIAEYLPKPVSAMSIQRILEKYDV